MNVIYFLKQSKTSDNLKKKVFKQLSVQGVSENMQQLLISTKIGCKPGRLKVIYQIQAYNHTILLIIKNPETDTK